MSSPAATRTISLAASTTGAMTPSLTATTMAAAKPRSGGSALNRLSELRASAHRSSSMTGRPLFGIIRQSRARRLGQLLNRGAAAQERA